MPQSDLLDGYYTRYAAKIRNFSRKTSENATNFIFFCGKSPPPSKWPKINKIQARIYVFESIFVYAFFCRVFVIAKSLPISGCYAAKYTKNGKPSCENLPTTKCLWYLYLSIDIALLSLRNRSISANCSALGSASRLSIIWRESELVPSLFFIMRTASL